MTGYLLDTNVISELTRDIPDPNVVTFLVEESDLWLSSIVIYELEYGVQLLPRGLRRDHLGALNASIISEYDNRILPLDKIGAEWAARFRAQAHRTGRPLDLGDALVAGVAKANALSIATRNVGDFVKLDVEVSDPWQPRQLP